MRRRAAQAFGLLMAGMVIVGGGGVLAQVRPGSESGLGLSGADVPPLLADIKAEPYKAPAAPACDTVPAEILAINDLLGADLDAPPPEPEDTKKSLFSKSEGLARSLVPYGGVVRFVTGANKKDKELREAIMAGYARRGFLRGIEINLKCHPDPPPGDSTPAKAAHARRKAAKPQ